MSNQSTYLLLPRPFAALPCPSDAVVPATAIATNDVTQGSVYGKAAALQLEISSQHSRGDMCRP